LVSTVTYPKPLLSKAEWCRYCIHFTTLNLNHFKMDEAIGLKAVESRSPYNGITPIQHFIQIYELVQKLFGGHTQADR
jgi:hypothetical protein